MGFAAQLQDNILKCTFPPRMDTATCLEMQKEISSQIENAKCAVVFDLQDVVYVASAFLRICLVTYQKIGGDNFSCIHSSPGVKKVFKIAGFDNSMRIE